MDEALLKAIEQRADELWQAAGSPDGHELAYRLQAEQEIANTSVAGKEDPLSCVEVDDYRGYSAEDALRRGVEDAVAEPESLAPEPTRTRSARGYAKRPTAKHRRLSSRPCEAAVRLGVIAIDSGKPSGRRDRSCCAIDENL